MPNHPLTEKYGITPGPWVNQDGMIYGKSLDDAEESFLVCDVSPGYAALNEQDVCNARAIAKVPAMIEALERAIPQLILLGNYIGNEWPGGGGIEAFDRCALIEDVRALLSELEEEAGS